MSSLDVSLLRPSQLDVAELIEVNDNYAVFSDMGFGKTAAVITAVEKLFAKKKVSKLLVVSPLLVARETWPEELKSWKHASKLKFISIAGKPSKRAELASEQAQVYLINQELFVWLAEIKGKSWPYDMIVFDDCAGFKSGQKKTKSATCKFRTVCPLFRKGAPYGCRHAYVDCRAYREGPRAFTRFGAVCSLRGKIKRIVQLTGTPTSKDMLDLWPLIYTLDAGQRLKRTFSDYKRTYFNKSYNGFTWELRPGASKIISDKIKDICAAIPSEAILPPCYHTEYKIALPPEAEKKYAEFARDMILALDGQGGEIEAVNAGVLAGKLLQVCGGAVYKDGVVENGVKQPKEWAYLHSAKIIAVQKLRQKHLGEPLLVAYNFKHELIRLKKAFPDGVDIRDSKTAVSDWNAGKIPMLFVHPASAGHGLNLQKGPGRVLIWFGLNWSLSLTKQLNKRLHRPGQKRSVFVYYIVAAKKIDVDVMRGVAKHDCTQQELLTRVRRRVAGYLQQKEDE